MLRRLLLVLCIMPMCMYVFGACTPVAPPFFSPGSGTFEDPVYVSLNLPEGTTEVFYTLDGTEPGETCLIYTGGVIEISKTSVLKVKYSVGLSEQPIEEASYTIGSGGGGSGPFTNEAMIEAFAEMETTAGQVVEDEFNNGCTLFLEEWSETASACVDFPGIGNFDQLGKWYFVCDNGASTTPIAWINNSPAIVPDAPPACGSDGFLAMGLFSEGMAGRTDFVYEYHDYTISDGGGNLTVVSGRTVGHFDANTNGTISTQEGEQALLSDAFNGTIDSSLVVTDKNPTGGFFVTHCSDAGCTPAPSTYLVAPGPVYTLFEPGEPSCEQPWHVIQNGLFNTCLTHAPGANEQDLIYTACTAVPGQQWNVLPVESTPATDDFTIETAASDGCLTPVAVVIIAAASVQPCALNDPTQIWTLETVGAGPKALVKSQPGFFGEGTQFCLQGQFFIPPAFDPIQAECDLGQLGEGWQFLPNGQLPPDYPSDL